MTIILDVLSVLVIICMIGAMLYVTKALKVRKENKASKDDSAKKQNLRTAGIFFCAYLLLNLLRLYLESNLV